MNFLKDAQTVENLHITIPRLEKLTSPTTTILSFGSCFAQNLQAHIVKYGIRVAYLRDICGHYSTGSMAQMISRLVHEHPIEETDLYRFPETGSLTAYEYMLKRRYHGPNAKEKLVKDLRDSENIIRKELLECDIITLTLGTSRIIKLKRNDRIINAASGIAPENWYSEMLSVQENVLYLDQIFSDLKALGRKTMPHIILTISPQRYLFSEGIEELRETSPFLDNTLAKSILRIAVEEFARKHRSEDVSYFPSFEIVMDELRLHETISTYDYCHIEQSLTPKYVVKRFLQTYCSDASLTFLSNFEKVAEIHSGICTDVDNGMSFDSPCIQRRLELIEDIKANIPTAFVDATVSRIEIDRLQREEQHERVIAQYAKACDHLQDLRSKWKVAQSYLALKKHGDAESLLIRLRDSARCMSEAMPNLCKDIEHSLNHIKTSN